MTSGERMVWAAEFVRVMAMPDGHGLLTAVRSATLIVMDLRNLKDSHQLNIEERVMLDDMLSTGESRCRQ